MSASQRNSGRSCNRLQRHPRSGCKSPRCFPWGSSSGWLCLPPLGRHSSTYIPRLSSLCRCCPGSWCQCLTQSAHHRHLRYHLRYHLLPWASDLRDAFERETLLRCLQWQLNFEVAPGLIRTQECRSVLLQWTCTTQAVTVSHDSLKPLKHHGKLFGLNPGAPPSSYSHARHPR